MLPHREVPVACVRAELVAMCLRHRAEQLFRCQDKALRQLLFNFIVTDIKNTNDKRNNMKLNRAIQTFMYSMLKDENDTAARKSLDVLIALYRKRVRRRAHWERGMALAPTLHALTSCVVVYSGVDRREDRERAGHSLPFRRACRLRCWPSAPAVRTRSHPS